MTIPTEEFDPSKHVISCRETKEGRQVFVTLESLSKAEAVYEQAQPRPQPEPDNAVYLAVIDQKFQEIQDSIPPPQLSQETTAALAELAKALLATNARLDAVNARTDDVLGRVERLEKTLLLISEKLA